MCEPALLSTPVETVLQRVASELGSAASELADIEARLAAMIGSGFGEAADFEQLQTLDRLGQQMRVLELFLCTAAAHAPGEMDLTQSLSFVWLESVRQRLGGAPASVAAAAVAGADDAELW